MGLDSEIYLWQPGAAVAYLEGYELSAPSGSHMITLMFPQQTPAAFTTKGLSVRFSSGLVRLGQQLASGPGQSIEVIYAPAHPIKEGGSAVNEFSSAYGAGAATIVFDAFEDRLYGEIKGTLKYAKLYGYFMMIDSGERIPPRQPVVLELYNWPFDVRLERSQFYR